MEDIMMAKGHALTGMVRSRVDLVDPAHRIYVAELSAMVKTSNPYIARKMYDYLERSTALPDRQLSPIAGLKMLGKWDDVLRKNMKREAAALRAALKRDYHVEGSAVDEGVKEMEEYQIQGSDIRLLLARFAGLWGSGELLTGCSRNGILRVSCTEA